MLTTEPHSLLPFSLWVKSVEIYKNGIQTTVGINLKTTELFLKEIVTDFQSITWLDDVY